MKGREGVDGWLDWTKAGTMSGRDGWMEGGEWFVLVLFNLVGFTAHVILAIQCTKQVDLYI